MAPRPTWKGNLRLSLVSVPVQAVNVSESGGGEIHFHQLHGEDHARIRYKKVCPTHGEVPNDEIVSGYEYTKGQYVVVDPDELEKLRGVRDQDITIDTFVDLDEIDPIYYDGRDYYLIPETAAGQKSYAVLYEAMKKRNCVGIAQVVFSGKEQLVLIRPVDDVFVMSMLRYESQVRQPASVRDESAAVEPSHQEVKLAQMLVDASTAKKFDYARYQDLYTKRLRELIESKVEGEELVSPPAEEETHVINLMDALKKSVARAKGANKARPKPVASHGRPKKKLSPSRQPSAARRRKSS